MKSNKELIRTLATIFNETLIVCLYVFLVYTYIGNVDEKFKGDGKGYYDYLPSIFIYHDLVRKDLPLSENPEVYNRLNSTVGYVAYKEYMVNMYACGTALLELPFFIFTHLTTELEGTYSDGYQLPFQRTIYYTALFYVFLSLIFLKKVLKTYQIRPGIITFCQLLMVLATPVTIYANKDAGFSHVFSMFAITAFIYYIRSFFLYGKGKDIIVAALLLGLILILRQVNLMIVLFVPFLAGSYSNLVKRIRNLVRNYRIVILALFCFLAVFSVQAIMWYLQTGDFLIYSYQGYSFNFLDPQFFKILFGYKKGFFVYTPVMFIAFLSVIWLGFRKRYFLVFTWIGFFIFITYILSSWFSWYYGASYGLRAYIDYFTVFFIPLAILLNESNRVPRHAIIALSILTIPLNIIQTYQYRNYILHNINMDKEKYWRIFLQRDKQFMGLLYKTAVDIKDYEQVDERTAGNFIVLPGEDKVIYTTNSSDLIGFKDVSLIQVSIDNDFLKQNDTRIALIISDKEESEGLYWQRRYLIHFADDELNKPQTGTYNYSLEPFEDLSEKKLTLLCYSGKESTKLKNIRIRFLRKK
ncbi:MAG: hypothetical protein K8R52_02540 [Bacteroidales bacterium]|nr:hypothetical protein [Bacteroidales bacterium]